MIGDKIYQAFFPSQDHPEILELKGKITEKFTLKRFIIP